MTPNRTCPRGFSLIELMIALAVSATVIAGAVGAALAQQRAYYGTQRMRAAQSSARTALLFIQEKARMAGFGMDPALAFDFGVYTPATGTCPPEANGCARDSAGDSDELVFYSRNPNYWVPNDVVGNPVGRAWLISNVSSTTVTITAHGGEVFPAGQILAAVCPGGRYYAYMTVGATTPARGATAPAGTLQLPLAAVDTTNPFKRQDLAVSPGSDPPSYFNGSASAFASPPTASGCFTSGARLFQIDRYRFHVRPVVVGGFPGGKVKYDPYLVLDMGIDTNLDGVIDASDELVIAEGVEIMQVAYSMANLALPTPTVGLTPGTAITFAPGLPGSTSTNDEITVTAKAGVQVATLPLSFQFAPKLQPADNPYAATSWYSYTLTQPLPTNYPRLTDSQANIRRVRVGLVVRSPEPDLQAPTTLPLDTSFQLYNLNAVPAWISANAYPSVQDGYARVQVEASVLVPNMTNRGMIFF
jgi:type IV pilus assembly protein PilW